MIKLENKNYNTLSNHLKKTYNKKVFKVSLNANFTCPNIDGKSGYGGCTFCTPLNSGDFAGNKNDSIEIQFKTIKERMLKKWPDALYIPYFQAGTNTYDSLDNLKDLYERAITLDEKNVALSISTRPDCLEDEIIEYLSSLNKKTKLWVEVGLQTSNETTAKIINRAHDLDIFESSIKKLRSHNIDVIVHVINGLPNETKEDMINTIEYVNKFDIQGIKIHMLHIMKNTKMGVDFIKKPFKVLSLEEYVQIVCDQLELIPEHVVIHRLTGDAPKDLLIEPNWTLKKFVVLNEIDKEFKKRGTKQGYKYKK